eukprot:s3058_g17.t1
MPSWESNIASACESSALIARGALQELEEWCFSKRAIYFNSADKKQVESRDSTGKALQKLQDRPKVVSLQEGYRSNIIRP